MKNAEKQKADLLSELEAEQQKVKEMKAEYEAILKVYEALEGVPLEDICRQLQYEYSDSIPPRVVVYEKIKSGDGKLIMALANRLKERN